MRNRLIYSLLTLFALFLIGSGITMLSLYETTTNLESVINLHRVEIIRQDLVINAQTVQTHLYTFGTVFGQELDVIVDNVLDLDESAHSCLGCHHTEEIEKRLIEVGDIVEQYKDALSYLITTSANPERIERLRTVAIGVGNSLLSKTQEMAFIAGQKLNSRTVKAIKDINKSRGILIATLVLSFIIAFIIAVTMTRQITEPIDELVNATRKIKSGQLGYTTSYKGKNEFGELIESFNDMSSSLYESNQKIMQHLHSLSNLYRVTLTFHAITNKADLYREISFGVSELVDAEQCGLLLDEGESFVHEFPAVGLDEREVKQLRIPREKVLDVYHAARRKALIANDGLGSSPAPEINGKLGVRNLMYVWIRHKGELIGAIRVANKRTGDFTEEDVRPLAILANNVSVALENTQLYEDLRRQMRELRDAQEQLVQAAKLVAIGELASNVAHEINNPLTSVLGYAELIREEPDLEAILKDVEVIEKEALRAREIVNQLLEFSRKRPLELKNLQVNDILRDVIDLVSFKLKDSRITISKEYGDTPVIRGDKNQLKQVFLNLINNAIYSMDGEGTLGITTGTRDGHVLISISDTGRGIPKDIQERIFEPFFTTKSDKGTGLGLSVSYKIIQSHRGRIEVQSEENKGCRFTVVLPVDYEAKREALRT
jgi:signal transduction histidine kinase/HAMP domain-containing protein